MGDSHEVGIQGLGMSVGEFDLLVFGASGKTGVQLARHAQSRGLRVAAMLRAGRDEADLAALAVHVLRGDAFEREDCARVIAQTRPAAIVSLLGGRDAQGRRIDTVGNINVIDAAQGWQADARLLLLTSMGCDEQFQYMPPQVQQLLGEALHAKTEAERHLRHSTLRWTIVRPGGLADAPGVGRYRASEQMPMDAGAYLSRADVALATLDLLAASAHVGKVFTLAASQD
ncbi:MAG: NAD(P)H-binding protein [Rhodocyclaceae bacterium]